MTDITHITITHLGERNAWEMAQASLRYEAMRRLTPNQFGALHRSHLMGENFDALVDMIVKETRSDKFKEGKAK